MAWKKILGAKALENAGNSLSVRIDNDTVVFIARVDGKLYAMNGICTHLRCILGKVTDDKKHVRCPCHLAEFELETGKMVKPPYIAPDSPMEKLGLKTYNIKEEDGFLQIDY
ncbi:sulredoxin [Picrophilus oshimae]|uniref:Ferredoxin subunit of nitrite reductase or a ring-hydroxylating dioxygenase n=1 Tax=Picrophilus torridus (strain ATCC 700027 / DSM 9790 / JCM 10055 / NBRC 100828 / KAW 2/3) TaxID=1122961 RepID=A0A8G2FXL8_PICTO|nr:sulredoxin [Picrophilus oshimae]SMD31386.1 Ferredoxin subunit of nitrite reductase or a ring-hydroxylating dioxygenase [Picrophilus oshimae DSM 9789]